MSTIKIYIVNGYPRSGKDAFMDFCLDKLSIYGRKTSTIDFVKYIAKECGWDGTKTEKNRLFLSVLKGLLTDWNDVPNRKIFSEVLNFKDYLDAYDIPDSRGTIFIVCREPREIDKLKEMFPTAKALLIRRDSNAQEYSNDSDREVENYNYDITIENNGTLEELKEKAHQFIKEEGIYYYDFSIKFS